MLTPQDAVNPALVGRCIDVLWPEDGTWWKAKVINLNPVTGMATLYYEPKEKQDGGDAPKEEGEKSRMRPTRIRTLYARRAGPRTWR